MAYATGRCMCHSFLKMPFEEEDIVAMVRKVFAGRVMFYDGAEAIVPGITVHKVGGHSKGLQCVRVKTRRGYVVLASDATHLYDHFGQGRVFPTTYNPAEVLEGYDLGNSQRRSTYHPWSRSSSAQALSSREVRAGGVDRATRRRTALKLKERPTCRDFRVLRFRKTPLAPMGAVSVVMLEQDGWPALNGDKFGSLVDPWTRAQRTHAFGTGPFLRRKSSAISDSKA